MDRIDVNVNLFLFYVCFPSLSAAPSFVIFKCYIYISRVNQTLSSKPTLHFPLHSSRRHLGELGWEHGEQPKLLKLNVVIIIINKVKQAKLLLVKFPPLLPIHTHTPLETFLQECF